MARDAVTAPRAVLPGAGALRRLAAMLAALAGWRRGIAAVGLGLAAAGAMPPFNLVLLLLPGFAGLVWLLEGAATRRRAFLDGWAWGMGFFVPSLYWIAESMFVDIAQFWWMVPFAVLGLPAYLSLYTGGATLAATLLSRPGTLRRSLVFAVCWIVAEWLRGHLLTGFPWLLAGYAWSADWTPLLAVLQSAALFGIYGLTFFTVLASVLPATLRLRPTLAAAALLVAALAWGEIRLAPGADPNVPNVTLRIVSTDLPHRAEWTREDVIADFHHVLSLAESPGRDKVQAEIWPEGVVETALNLNAAARQAVASAGPPDGVIITGTLRQERVGAESKAWNNISALAPDGNIVASYDKHHLVPFGEYVPLHSLLSFSQIASQRFDFSVGSGPQTLDLPGLPAVAPIICYEAIFPGDVMDPAHPAGWLVNVTDDGWFGRSTGPSQHFAIARVRAVEEGVPLVRAANGGISGVVDAHGRRVATLAVGKEGALDVPLPQALSRHTPYAILESLSLPF